MSHTTRRYVRVLSATALFLAVPVLANEATLFTRSEFKSGDRFYATSSRRQLNGSGQYDQFGARIAAGSGPMVLEYFSNVLDPFLPGQTFEALADSTGGATQSARATTTDVPGTLDGTFNLTGLVSVDPGGTNSVHAVIEQTDGKILAGGQADGDFTTYRFNSDGSLDTSFGTSGVSTVDMGADDEIWSYALQTDGKIIVVGQTGWNWAIARLTTSGALDTTFNGTGKQTWSFTIGIDRAHYAQIQTDGKLVAVGRTSSDFALARLNTDGTLDTTFDSDGKVTTNMGTGGDTAWCAQIQSDGKIIAVGLTNNDAVVARYNTNGSLDTTFDSDGKVITHLASAALEWDGCALQSDGQIVTAGHSGVAVSSANLSIARYRTDGSLDTGFGASGSGIVDMDLGTNDDRIQQIALQSDGRIVGAGNVFSNQMTVRFLSDGTLDTTWGTSGTGIQNLGSLTDLLNAITLQSDGKVLVGGRSNGDYIVERYLP